MANARSQGCLAARLAARVTERPAAHASARLALMAAALALALGAMPARAAETIALDLSAAFNVDLLGTDAERLEAIAIHDANEYVNWTLYDIFGQHHHLGAPYDCYYVHNSYGLPTSGLVQTAFGPYQLGPAQTADVTTHQASPNGVTFGKLFGPDRIVATATLPAAQRGRYSDVNFLLVHWYRVTRNGGVADKRIRIHADYATGSPGLLYEGPVIGWSAAADATFAAARESARHISSAGSPIRGVTLKIEARWLWHFAQPLGLDPTRTLVGFRFEGTETEDDVEDLACIFAATGHRVAPADLPIQVALSKDYDWCYQNTPQTTLDRHAVVLTVSVVQPDPNGNSSYSVAVQQTAGPGSVTVQSTADPLVWRLVGGRRGDTAPGAVTVEATVTGNEFGGQGTASETLTVRLLGDIDAGGSVGLSDKVQLNKALNGLPTPGYELRHFDLTGDGSVGLQDKVQLNRVLNGLSVP